MHFFIFAIVGWMQRMMGMGWRGELSTGADVAGQLAWIRNFQIYFRGAAVWCLLLQSEVLMSSSARFCGTWMMQKPTHTRTQFPTIATVTHTSCFNLPLRILCQSRSSVPLWEHNDPNWNLVSCENNFWEVFVECPSQMEEDVYDELPIAFQTFCSVTRSVSRSSISSLPLFLWIPPSRHLLHLLLLFWFYITLHLPFSLSARDCFPERLPSMLRLMFLFLSRLRSSWKSSVTLWLVLADVSMKAHFHWLAWASPSFVSTSRWVSSLLLPTSMIGMVSTLPFMPKTFKGRKKYVCYVLSQNFLHVIWV